MSGSERLRPDNGDVAGRILGDELSIGYRPPQSEQVATSAVGEATKCACRAGDDNPWPQ